MTNHNIILNRHGAYLTSFDLIKALAIICVFIDHLGWFGIFPSSLYEPARLVGRIAAPIFFFLIGYAGLHKIPKSWYFYGLWLSICTMFFVNNSPLNIMFSFIMCRYLFYILPTANFNKYNSNPYFNNIALIILWPILLASYPFTKGLFEYGTLGLLFAICGILQRQQHPFKNLWIIATIIAYVTISLYLFLSTNWVLSNLYLVITLSTIVTLSLMFLLTKFISVTKPTDTQISID